MSQWKNTDDAANSVSWAATGLMQGSGKANRAANNTALYGNTTADAFIPKLVVGQFGVSIAEKANTSGESQKVAHAGWQLRRAGTGPVTGFAVTAPGSGFSNGETITVSGGATNATGVATANATGNLVSVAVTGDGGTDFSTPSSPTITFNREKHVANVLAATGGSGYSNTDKVSVSNGTINCAATVSTNSSGGLTNASFTITNPGIFAANQTNAAVVAAITNSTGGTSAGTGAALTAALGNSSGGTVTLTLGGRAGRVTYETLVAMGTLSNGTSDDTQLPQ